MGFTLGARGGGYPVTVDGMLAPPLSRGLPSQVVEGFRVVGGGRLVGSVRVPGAVESACLLMVATLLSQGRTTLVDVPDIPDIEVTARLLERFGCAVTWLRERGVLVVDVPEELAGGVRPASELLRPDLLGPVLARFGVARVELPRGDSVSAHGPGQLVRGLQALGADVAVGVEELMVAAPRGLRGGRVRLDFPGAGVTETLLLVAVLARGTTVLENCAREPEVVDLCRMLRRMGARIGGIATATLTVEGVERLRAVEHRVVPDRIAAGTWAFAAAITGGDVQVHNGEAGHLGLVLDKLAASGAEVSEAKDGFRVQGPERPVAVNVATLPYPGFPTDLQPFMMILDAVAEGTAVITENLVASRFGFAREVSRFGAQVSLDGQHALVRGVPRLAAASVGASGTRAGAALVLAGLVAEGETLVAGAGQVDRGYDHFEDDLRALGADVCRVPVSGAT